MTAKRQRFLHKEHRSALINSAFSKHILPPCLFHCVELKEGSKKRPPQNAPVLWIRTQQMCYVTALLLKGKSKYSDSESEPGGMYPQYVRKISYSILGHSTWCGRIWQRRLEETLQNKPSVSLLLNAKQETLRLLEENEEEWQARQLIAYKRQEQHRNSISKRKRSDPER